MIDFQLFGWITIFSYLLSPFIIIYVKGMSMFRDIWGVIYLNIAMFTFFRFIYPGFIDPNITQYTDYIFFLSISPQHSSF
jgi:hypothetical protein